MPFPKDQPEPTIGGYTPQQWQFFQQGALNNQQQGLSSIAGIIASATRPPPTQTFDSGLGTVLGQLTAALRGGGGRGGGGGGGGGGGAAAGPSYADVKTLGDMKLREALLRAAENNGQISYIDKARGLDQQDLNNALSYLNQQRGFAGTQRDINMGMEQNKSDSSRNTYLQQLDQYNSDATVSGAYDAAGRNRTRGYMATDQGLAQSLIDSERQGIGLDYTKSMADYGNQEANANLGYQKATLGHDQDAYNTFTQGGILGSQAEQQQQTNKMQLAGMTPGK